MVVQHSFNPWWGCTRVSPGCDHCYAEALDARAGGAHWGQGVPRRTFGDKYWAGPLKWNEAARKAGQRARVLCASMADVFDAEAPPGLLERLWRLIPQTPHLDWLLLTKRPARIARGLPAGWGRGYPNAWLGVTVENQELATQRIPVLLSVPARRRFLCCEPLLGPVELRPWPQGIDWVIAGGESGPRARPVRSDWVRGLRDACQEAGLPFYFKQWGYRPGRTLDGRTWEELPASDYLAPEPGATWGDCLTHP
jgi:protein gp37